MIKRLGTCALFILLTGHVAAQSVERGVPNCAPDAIAKAREGADRGEVASIYLMARYYSTGKCIAGDGEKAVAHYWQAAKMNYPPAYFNLGIVAAGGEKDYEKAELMFFRGAQLGHRGSELQLGILYQLAPPPVRDNVKSYAWLTVTANRGEPISQEAKSILEDLERKVTDEEKVKGKALASRLSGKFGNVPAFNF
jgi:TPR repeat protein